MRQKKLHIVMEKEKKYIFQTTFTDIAILNLCTLKKTNKRYPETEAMWLWNIASTCTINTYTLTQTHSLTHIHTQNAANSID